MSYSVGELAPADEASVRELYAAVFGRAMSSAKQHWLLAANPFSRRVVYVARAEDGRVIGHYQMIPQPFRDRGRRGLAALSVRSMVHPSFQNRGVLQTLAVAAAKQLDEDGVEMGMAFLNDNSLHAYTMRMGWTALEGKNPVFFTPLQTYGLVPEAMRFGEFGRRPSAALDWLAQLVFREAKPRRSSKATLRPIDRFNARFDRLWERFSAGVGRSVDRTSAYLNWRLADASSGYRVHALEGAGDALVGFVVIKTERKFGLHLGFVVELLFEGNDIDAGTELATHARSVLAAEGCAMATALTVGSPSVELALRRAGFRRLPPWAMPHGIHFCYQPRGTGDVGDTNAKWFLSWIDHDVV